MYCTHLPFFTVCQRNESDIGEGHMWTMNCFFLIKKSRCAQCKYLTLPYMLMRNVLSASLLLTPTHSNCTYIRLHDFILTLSIIQYALKQKNNCCLKSTDRIFCDFSKCRDLRQCEKKTQEVTTAERRTTQDTPSVHLRRWKSVSATLKHSIYHPAHYLLTSP